MNTELYSIPYNTNKYATAYIDTIYANAYHISMEQVTRTTKQAGEAIRRVRRQRGLSQSALGTAMHARQATVSKLEAGEPGTQLKTLIDALAALDLELVIRPRSSGRVQDLEDLF